VERIYLSSGTPKPSDRDLARFRILIEPVERGLATKWWWPRTVGEALDTKPGSFCRTRRLMYKAAAERVTFVAMPCGKASCPTCVVGWLSERVAPAWVLWNGRAAQVKVPSSAGKHSDRVYKRLGIKMRGPAAFPGILSIPLVDGGRGLFIPVGIVNGEYVAQGKELDDTLVQRLRELPFGTPTANKPMDYQATIPDRVTDERFAELTEAAGVPIDIRGVRHRVFLGVDQASWDAVRQLARGGS
jgi:hypothetical protein